MEKRIRAIWAKHEKVLGEPIPESVRNYVEKTLLPGVYDPDGLKDLDDCIKDYLKSVASWLESHPSGDNDRFPLNNESKKNTTKKKYRKCFERRFHLVEFVASQVLSMVHFTYQVFSPHRRIKWGPLCDEWNKEHPHDLMTPAILKVEYYRATAEKDIQRKYFLKNDKWFAPFRDSILRLVGTDDPKKLMRVDGQGQEEAYEILSKAIKQWIETKEGKK